MQYEYTFGKFNLQIVQALNRKKTLEILILLLPKLNFAWLSNISILSVPDANYSMMAFITYMIYYVYYFEQEVPSNTDIFSKKK